MVGYRIYTIGKEGHFVGVREVFASADSEAMLQARQFLDGLDVEVWRGNEKIGYLRGTSAKSAPPIGVTPRNRPTAGPDTD